MTAQHSYAQTFEFKAEMKQLLHLIAHSLYTHPEVFVRELISNASDALNKVRYRQITDSSILDYDSPLQITVTLDREKRYFCVEDSGIGMTKADLTEKLGTVASSGTSEFLSKLKESGGKLDGNLIGQFGVGFYSVFMVAEEITVETRHADADSVGLRWKSDGKGTFVVEEIEKPTRGTKIFFTLKEDAKEFSEEYRFQSLARKYSNFVDFPILLVSEGKEPERVNTVKALWQKSKDQIAEDELAEFYKFLTNDYQAPLGHLHLSVEGSANFKALVFVPATTPMRPATFENDKSLHLYSNKVMIQEHCKELLPEYLRFARGVVDTEDLPLNVSRETAQSSPVMAKINKVLTGKILGMLQEWAEQDASKYEKFYKNFGNMLKMGVNTDFSNRDAIVNLLRFETNLTPQGQLSSLKDYAQRMKSDQTAIYYFSGERRDVMLNNPNLEYFQKHGIEVLLLTDPVDVIIVPSIPTFEGKSLQSIDKAELTIEDTPQADAEKPIPDGLLKLFKDTLGDKVEDVVASRRLVDSAVTLVVGKEGMDVQMEKMLKALDKEFKGSKKVLEVNLEHPVLQNMSRAFFANAEDPLLPQYVLHLYEGALLSEGNLTTPTLFVRRMWEIMAQSAK